MQLVHFRLDVLVGDCVGVGENSPRGSIWVLSFHHRVLAVVGVGCAIPWENGQIASEKCQCFRDFARVRSRVGNEL